MNTVEQLDQATVEKLRGRLSAEFAAASAAIETSKTAMSSFLASRRDVEVDDEHDPEGSTLALQFTETSALLNNSRQHLDQAVVALGKIADGSYGQCEMCGQQIAIARLEARPAAAHCVPCASVVGL
jgi:DnaK suppressor protein